LVYIDKVTCQPSGPVNDYAQGNGQAGTESRTYDAIGKTLSSQPGGGDYGYV
jgi:hypothetical protein